MVQAVGSKQMAELDRLAVSSGTTIPMMMENAGLAVARIAERMSESKSVVVLAGKGNNGGDGLCAARHLINWGFKTKVFLASAKSGLNENSMKQLEALEGMGADVSFVSKPDFGSCGLIIDALLGYSIKGNPRGVFADMIHNANSSGRKILAVDLPSGLNPDTGKPYNPCIRAYATVTLCLPKKGLLEKAAKPYVGKLFVAYIGVPYSAYRKMKLKNPFKRTNLPRP
ncbi:NAD(P)H-hydrate epimerase [Candidatus Woesearchaeota archaeon]|nr:NAD(P)H-hydrate epimerase [Candidatus Woesearchaeota archaeon]